MLFFFYLNLHISKDKFYILLYNEFVFSNYFGEIQAVAFDIDGTLYKELSLNIRVLPRVFRHLYFFINYGRVRKMLRKKEFYEDFGKAQAELMGKKLKCSPEAAKEKLNNIVYEGLKKYFKRFNAYKGALEFIQRLKEAGVKIAVLSDFPPEQKGDIWGIKPYCDVVLGSEQIGALKPSPYVFSKLQSDLNVPAENILYVGNNHTYDVVGPKKAGMKAAWIISNTKAFLGKKSSVADFTFSKYSQLENKFFEK